MARPQRAAESLSLEDAANRLASKERHVSTILRRIQRIRALPQNATLLDVGCAQGQFLIACSKMGLNSVGVEPSPIAREVAARLAQREAVSIRLVAGVAEMLPIAPDSVDLVHMMSVVEHVKNAEATFREAYRVLKPGGVYWFFTASKMSPRQGEIRGFPCFGWYPDRLKRRIMNWAVRHRPHLVGHTNLPAINWFTPRKARRMLAEAGFNEVYDRWQLRLPCEGGRLYQTLLRLIRSNGVARVLADVVVPNCSYAAMK